MSEYWKYWEIVIVALTAWREARNQSRLCRQAIICCIRNRVHHPKWWGNDYVSVCTKRWQFSSINGPSNDPNLIQWPNATDNIFEECLEDAALAIAGTLVHPFPGADSYYSTYIPLPKWAIGQVPVGHEGNMLFYNIDGDMED